MQDRTYWRSQHSARLIEEGKASGHELAIAIAERLEDVEDALDQLHEKQERKGWGRSESEYIATIAVMRAEIKALEDQVSDLLGLGGDRE
jgi:hypothetical protein